VDDKKQDLFRTIFIIVKKIILMENCSRFTSFPRMYVSTHGKTIYCLLNIQKHNIIGKRQCSLWTSRI